jgi:hypothetical protein
MPLFQFFLLIILLSPLLLHYTHDSEDSPWAKAGLKKLTDIAPARQRYW